MQDPRHENTSRCHGMIVVNIMGKYGHFLKRCDCEHILDLHVNFTWIFLIFLLSFLILNLFCPHLHSKVSKLRKCKFWNFKIFPTFLEKDYFLSNYWINSENYYQPFLNHVLTPIRFFFWFLVMFFNICWHTTHVYSFTIFFKYKVKVGRFSFST